MYCIYVTLACYFICVITARVPSTTGRYCFHRCVSVYICQGGGTLILPGDTPSFPIGSTPFPGLVGGLGRGTPPIQTWEGGTPHLDLGRGYPHLGKGRGYPHLGKGYPLSRSGPRIGGTHNWNIIACTCYVVGGMPLGFTQEDFLVLGDLFYMLHVCTGDIVLFC